jgi:2-oxo-4-hydroxy-4-carboxy-5-ureidoimidazoline decarboxylase
VPRISLDELNRESASGFVRALGGIFEHSPWVAEAIVEQRPFANLASLHEAMKSAVLAAADDKKLALLRAHPDLAGKAAQAGTLTDDSKSEQVSAGLDRLSPQEIQRLHDLNIAYKAKFNFPFIVCVRRHTKETIFHQFETRLKNDMAVEYQAALDEVFHITTLRLDQHVGAGNRLNVESAR